VTRCAQRYAACSLESRAGHVSEIMHAQSYNLDAIKRGSDLRARVTEWAPGGSQQAPADIEVIRGSLVEKPFQVKMNDKPPVLAREAARPTYRDMGLVLPSDRIDQVDRIYDAVSRRPPQSEGYADYADARGRISDRVRHGGVESEPHTIGDAREVAKDPARWQRSQEVGAAYRDIGTAAAAGFLTAGALTFVIVGAQEASRWHHGEISSGQLAARAGRAAAAAGVRGGVVAGVGQTIGLAARSGHLPGLLGAGTVPYAVAGAALAVGEASFAYARGQISAAEFAAASGEAVATSAFVWVGGTIGQALIPIPVVGALVGGTIGQLVGGAVVGAVRADRAGDRALRRLETDAAATVETIDAARRVVEAAGAERNSHLDDVVLPALAGLGEVLDSAEPHVGLATLADLTRRFGGTPAFEDLAGFREWLAGPGARRNTERELAGASS